MAGWASGVDSLTQRGLSEAGERGSEQAGHLHLRDADPLADLTLGQPLAEPKGEQPAVAVGKLPHRRRERATGIDEVIAAVDPTDGVGERGFAIATLVRDGSVEAKELVCSARLQALTHLPGEQLKVRGQLVVSGEPTEHRGQLALAIPDSQSQPCSRRGTCSDQP